jgi:hypothetical protein
MKVKDGMTYVVGLPLDEANKITDAMEQAEKTGDLESLRWCARMLKWLYDPAEIIWADIYSGPEDLFNHNWSNALERDPPPPSIATIIMKPNKEDQDGVNAITFYPAERVQEIFERMKAAKGTTHEAEEYRIFALRMERLFDRYSFESNTRLEDEAALRLAAIGEAVEDEEFVASITARTLP